MDETIGDFRSFNRFFTRYVGLLNRHLLHSSLKLAEARTLFEVAATPGICAKDLCRRLDMDAGQLSRIVALLLKRELIRREGRPGGRTPLPLVPTKRGRETLRRIEADADKQAAALLAHLDEDGRGRFRQALGEVRILLESRASPSRAGVDEVTIREAKSGELGWIISQHAKIYEREYGFSAVFEDYVLLGMAEYLRDRDGGSRVWVAECGGRPAGSVAIVKKSGEEAQLRWLLVAPEARGLGLGKKLVERAVSFGREQGFERIILWTLANLDAARGLYKAHGFKCVEARDGTMGGQALVEERWVLELGRDAGEPEEMDTEDRRNA